MYPLIGRILRCRTLGLLGKLFYLEILKDCSAFMFKVTHLCFFYIVLLYIVILRNVSPLFNKDLLYIRSYIFKLLLVFVTTLHRQFCQYGRV
jgi:hypothetical protein